MRHVAASLLGAVQRPFIASDANELDREKRCPDGPEGAREQSWSLPGLSAETVICPASILPG
jgi:hypothetical protein